MRAVAPSAQFKHDDQRFLHRTKRIGAIVQSRTGQLILLGVERQRADTTVLGALSRVRRIQLFGIQGGRFGTGLDASHRFTTPRRSPE